MSNEALTKMQTALDRERTENRELEERVKALEEQAAQAEELQASLRRLKTEYAGALDRARTEGTVRAREQIEELREQVGRLEAELKSTKSDLTTVLNYNRELEQRTKQAEAHMKQMASERKETPATKTYRKDRIRKSQR